MPSHSKTPGSLQGGKLMRLHSEIFIRETNPRDSSVTAPHPPPAPPRPETLWLTAHPFSSHTDHLTTTQITKPGKPTWEMFKASSSCETWSRGARRHQPLREQARCSTLVNTFVSESFLKWEAGTVSPSRTCPTKTRSSKPYPT